MHLGRVLVMVAVLVLIHLQHRRWLAEQRSESMASLSIDGVRVCFPDAHAWGDAEPHGGRSILSSSGEAIGYAIQTAPDSDAYLGFSGPTNLLIVFDLDHRIRG